MVWPPLLKNWETYSHKELHQDNLIEDCLREQVLLSLPMSANQKLLYGRNAFLGTLGHKWRLLKELAVVFIRACCGVAAYSLSL